MFFNIQNKIYKFFLHFFILICIITYLRKLTIFNIIYLKFNNIENFIKSIKIILFSILDNTFYFFTSQSNFLVIIVLFLNFTKFKNKKYYSLLTFITLIDILLTGIVWNLIASPTNELLEIKKYFLKISFFEHFYIPLFYIIFYYSSFYVPCHSYFSLKKAYYALFHPLFYLFYSLLLAYLSEEKIYNYPYNFVCPYKKTNISSYFFHLFKIDNYQKQQGFLGVFINNLFLFIVLLITIPFLYIIKKNISKRKNS
ncbi:hypothetical protein [Candidatus Phytoplasma sacchari]